MANHEEGWDHDDAFEEDMSISSSVSSSDDISIILNEPANPNASTNHDCSDIKFVFLDNDPDAGRISCSTFKDGIMTIYGWDTENWRWKHEERQEEWRTWEEKKAPESLPMGDDTIKKNEETYIPDDEQEKYIQPWVVSGFLDYSKERTDEIFRRYEEWCRRSGSLAIPSPTHKGISDSSKFAMKGKGVRECSNLGPEAFKVKMILSPDFSKEWIKRFPEEIQLKICDLAYYSTWDDLFQTQQKLKKIWHDRPICPSLSGIEVIIDTSQHGNLLTTIIRLDEVEDENLQLVTELYDQGLIRRLILEEKQPTFLPLEFNEILEERRQKQTWEIHSSNQYFFAGQRWPVERYMKIYFGELYYNCLEQPSETNWVLTEGYFQNYYELYGNELCRSQECYGIRKEDTLLKVLSHSKLWTEDHNNYSLEWDEFLHRRKRQREGHPNEDDGEIERWMDEHGDYLEI